MSPSSRARATNIAVGVAFAAAAGWLYVRGDESDGSLPYFLTWLAAHVAYGLWSGSFWALVVALACPPLFVAAGSGSFVEAVFVEVFYGLPFVFTGVVARRLWQARRPVEPPEG